MAGEPAMIILALRTDKPEAELYLYDGDKKLAGIERQAHLKLAETIHQQIKKVLMLQGLSLQQIKGIAIYKGPGSFTGLRIGMSVANALAYARAIPIVAKGGDDWLAQSIKALRAGKNDKIATPRYGAPARVTKPRK